MLLWLLLLTDFFFEKKHLNNIYLDIYIYILLNLGFFNQTLIVSKLNWASTNIIYKNILYLNQVKLKFFNKPIGSHTPIRRYTQQFSPYRLRWRYQPYPPKFDTSNVCPSKKSLSTYLIYYHLCEPFRVVTISNLTHDESSGISHQCVSISNEK